MCHHLGAAALDHHLAEVHHGDALGELQRHVHVVLDHHDGDVARDRGEQALHVTPLVDRQAGERLVEQQHLRVLRQRHGDLDAAALAVGGLRERPSGDMQQPDPRERRPARLDQRRLSVETAEADSSAGRESPSSDSIDVAQQRLAVETA